MSAVFDAIVAGGYYQAFGGLTAEQERCRDFTRTHLADLLVQRQRDKFLHEIVVCACGYAEADEDEPMDGANFSQFQFYRPFTEDLVAFEDRFDFLIKCVANGVCKIAAGFEERYEQALLNALTFREITTPAFPEYVLELRQLQTPRTVGEQARPAAEQEAHFQSFVQRRNSFACGVRAELAQLEEEQRLADLKRTSIMGWESGAAVGGPSSNGDAAVGANGSEKVDVGVSTASASDTTSKEEGCPASGASSSAPPPATEPFDAPTGAAAAAAAHAGDESAAPAATASGELGASERTPMLNLLLALQHDDRRAASAASAAAA